MKLNRIYLMIFIVLFPIFCIGQSSHADEIDDANVYIVVVNKLTLSDIDNMENIKNLVQDGSIGLMNTRGMSGYKGEESFATINASTKTYANRDSSQFHDLNYEYGKVYESRMGTLYKGYNIGNIQMGRLYNQNKDNDYSPYIGALGDSLHDLGLKTAVFGNSDIEGEAIRMSPLILMDSKGLIDYGNLEDILVRDLNYPYGIRTDYDKILNEMSDIKSRASVILVDTGDLSRLNSYGNFLPDDIFSRKRNLILNSIDGFIKSLVETLNKEKSLLMIISPNSGDERVDDSKLSPIIFWGKNVEKGIITSYTTNKKGIISNLDIAPTIIDFFQMPIRNMAGNPIGIIEEDGAMDYIKSINMRINTTSKVRFKTLLVYSIVSIIVMAIMILIFTLNIEVDDNIKKVFKMLLLLLYGFPIISILHSIFPIYSVNRFVINLIIILGICGFLSIKYNNIKTIFLISSLFYSIIMIDLLLNGSIARFSVFNHDPIIGARYFGIGNEMAGGFLAAATLSIGFLLDRYNKRFPLFILVLSIIIMGHPRLGANMGGTIAMLFSSIYLILEIMKKHMNIKNIILSLVVIGLIIATITYIDISFSANTTHIGKTLVLLNEKGVNIVKNIIGRKLLMNIKLVGTSIWTKVLFTCILIQGVISYRYKNMIGKLMNNGLGKGMVSGMIGSIIGFLLNDSGIIFSAISMNLMTIFLIFIIIDGKDRYIKREVD